MRVLFGISVISFGLVMEFAALAGAGEASITLESLLKEMVDRDAIARWPEPAYTCRQASSYDRHSKTPADPKNWFANTDNMDGLGADLKWETNPPYGGRREAVMLDVEGPGCIVRFWSGGQVPKGHIRFYLDGAEAPAIDAPMQDLMSGKGFVPKPLAIENAGRAINLYLPVPYAKHCKITYDEGVSGRPNAPPPGRWFNIEYRTYPAGTNVQTFTMDALKAASETLQRVTKELADVPVWSPPFRGSSPLPEDRLKAELQTVEKTVSLESGKEVAIDLPGGPAALRRLTLRLDGVPQDEIENALRKTILRTTFDGEEAVWCPVGDFFGSGVGLNALSSWYRTIAKDGAMTCRWVMPYEKSGRLALLNLGKSDVGVKLSAAVGDWRWDDRSMHFHSSWRQERFIPTRPFSDWNYITITGKGVYLGDSLAIFNPVRDWWGEGDEHIWVDGETFPSHFGTGSEDYYGYAWGNPTVFQGPFCNQPRVGVGGNFGHTTNTRTRSLDAVPFAQSLKMEIEVWHWADCKVGYAVATYWYARPGATSNRGPEPDEAAAEIRQPPTTFRIKGAIECEKLPVVAKSPGVVAEPQRLDPFPGQWSDTCHLFVRANKVGDFVELRIPADPPKARKMTLYATKSWDYGILRFSVNGARAEKEFDGYSEKPVPSGPIELGVFEPKDGQLLLRAEVVGANPNAKGTKAYLGLDCVVLSEP